METTLSPSKRAFRIQNPFRRILSIALVSVGLVPSGAAAVDLDAAVAKARSWLVSQSYPSGLLNSQSDLPNVSYTYDNAVAACAFLSLNDTSNARIVLARLAQLQDTSGAWYTAYDKAGKVVDGNQKWIGPCAWVVMAMARYHAVTGSPMFDTSARKAIGWELRCRNADGSLWTYSVDDKATYTSTEENEDAYAGMVAFGYATEAAALRTFLTKTVWDATRRRWIAGPDADPADLSYLFSDVNSWGVLALGSEGPANWKDALAFNQAHHHATVSQSGKTVSGFSFGADTSDVWLEGTGQMAAAFHAVGDAQNGDFYVGQIANWQDASGGITYSMRGGPTGDGWNMPTSNSVSATAWFVLAAKRANPFDLASVASRVEPRPLGSRTMPARSRYTIDGRRARTANVGRMRWMWSAGADGPAFSIAR